MELGPQEEPRKPRASRSRRAAQPDTPDLTADRALTQADAPIDAPVSEMPLPDPPPRKPPVDEPLPIEDPPDGAPAEGIVPEIHDDPVRTAAPEAPATLFATEEPKKKMADARRSTPPGNS